MEGLRTSLHRSEGDRQAVEEAAGGGSDQGG